MPKIRPKSKSNPKLTQSRSCPNLISLDSSLDDNLAAKLHCYKSTQLKKAPTANLRIRSSKTLAPKNRQVSNRVPRLCTRYGWVSGWGPTCGAVSFLVGQVRCLGSSRCSLSQYLPSLEHCRVHRIGVAGSTLY